MTQKINLVVLGHIDHGKSTLIGRLLYDSGSLPEERIEEVKKTAEQLGKDMEFAFFMDNLEEERENAMTIDIIHTPFKSNSKEYLLIDCPGHKELIKNMLSGASQANSVIVVVSAKLGEGIQEQTKRHIFLARMLGIEQIFVAINKMDEVSYNEEKFNEIKNALNKFLIKLNYGQEKIFFVPVSAKLGENLLKKSEKMSWYKGECLIDLLEKNVTLPIQLSEKPFIGLVQDIYDIDSDKIIITKIETGRINVGEETIFNLCEEVGKIKSIRVFGEDRDFAESGESIGLEIGNIDLSKIKRGEVVSKDRLNKVQDITAKIFLLSESDMKEKDTLQIRCGTAERECQLTEIRGKIDSSTGEKLNESNKVLKHTEIALVSLRLSQPIIAEKFSFIPALGRFLLIKDKKIVAVGVIGELFY